MTSSSPSTLFCLSTSFLGGGWWGLFLFSLCLADNSQCAASMTNAACVDTECLNGPTVIIIIIVVVLIIIIVVVVVVSSSLCWVISGQNATPHRLPTNDRVGDLNPDHLIPLPWLLRLSLPLSYKYTEIITTCNNITITVIIIIIIIITSVIISYFTVITNPMFFSPNDCCFQSD